MKSLLAIVFTFVAFVSALPFAQADVILKTYETCGILAFDQTSKNLKFADFRRPSPQLFEIAQYYDIAKINGSTIEPFEVFQKIEEMFYKPVEPRKPRELDEEKASRGIMVRLIGLPGPRYVSAKPHSVLPGKRLLSPSTAMYLQILDIQQISPKDCQPVKH